MQILFTTRKSLVSTLIRWFEKDKNIAWKDVPGHAAIRFGGQESNWMIQSHRHGVEPYWWPLFQSENQIVATYNISSELPEKDLDLLLENYISKVAGKGYDFSAILGFAYIQICKKFLGRAPRKNPTATPDRYFCSELVVRMLQFYEQATGLSIIEKVDPEATSPLDLMRLLDKSKYFSRI